MLLHCPFDILFLMVTDNKYVVLIQNAALPFAELVVQLVWAEDVTVDAALSHSLYRGSITYAQ